MSPFCEIIHHHKKSAISYKSKINNDIGFLWMIIKLLKNYNSIDGTYFCRYAKLKQCGIFYIQVLIWIFFLYNPNLDILMCCYDCFVASFTCVWNLERKRRRKIIKYIWYSGPLVDISHSVNFILLQENSVHNILT